MTESAGDSDLIGFNVCRVKAQREAVLAHNWVNFLDAIFPPRVFALRFSCVVPNPPPSLDNRQVGLHVTQARVKLKTSFVSLRSLIQIEHLLDPHQIDVGLSCKLVNHAKDNATVPAPREGINLRAYGSVVICIVDLLNLPHHSAPRLNSLKWASKSR